MGKEKFAKTSLFGYSKKQVDEIVEEMNAEFNSKLQQAVREKNKGVQDAEQKQKEQIDFLKSELDAAKNENNRLKSRNIELEGNTSSAAINLKSDYDSLYANYTALQSELALKNKTLSVLQAEYANKSEKMNALLAEIIRLRTKSYQQESPAADFGENAKALIEELVKSNSEFDEYLEAMKENIKKLSELCSGTEKLFNDTFVDVADFLLGEKKKKDDSEDEDEALTEESEEEYEEDYYDEDLSQSQQVS